MMKTSGRLAILIAVLALVGACGNGTKEAEKKPAPPPKTYTAAQLEAAMPSKDDFPGATKDVRRCPGDSELCSEPDTGKSWLAYTQLKPLYEGSGSDVEKAAKQRWFGDTMSFNVWLHEDAAAAEKFKTTLSAEDEKYVGAYDTTPKEVEGENVSIGTKGTGSIEKVRIKGWSGTVLDQKEVGTNAKGESSEERQTASVTVAAGLMTISAHVNVSVEGHGADDAQKLVEKLVADYLERLEAA